MQCRPPNVDSDSIDRTGITSRPDFTDFILEPETVADAVFEQVLSGYGAELILPSRLIPVSGLREWPRGSKRG